MQKQECLISFEGGEGSGKSTQTALLAERLRAAGRVARIVREPGGTALGEEARRILKHASCGENLDARAELLLFAASRAQLVTEVVRPALAVGEVVLCDRFADSSAAYQGGGRGLPPETVAAINAFATDGLAPNLTVLLDLPAAEGIARARRRAAIKAKTAPPSQDRMEALDIAFHERVRAGYLALAAREPERFFVADASLSTQALAAQIWLRVAEKLGLPPAAAPA
jgi:dTMP kinase